MNWQVALQLAQKLVPVLEAFMGQLQPLFDLEKADASQTWTDVKKAFTDLQTAFTAFKAAIKAAIAAAPAA